jgi:hypothetical protein
MMGDRVSHRAGRGRLMTVDWASHRAGRGRYRARTADRCAAGELSRAGWCARLPAAARHLMAARLTVDAHHLRADPGPAVAARPVAARLPVAARPVAAPARPSVIRRQGGRSPSGVRARPRSRHLPNAAGQRPPCAGRHADPSAAHHAAG